MMAHVSRTFAGAGDVARVGSTHEAKTKRFGKVRTAHCATRPPVKTEAVNEREGSNLVVLTRIAMVEQSTVANEASVDLNGCGLRAGEDAEGVVADVSSERLRVVGERAPESGRETSPVESLRARSKFVIPFFLSQRLHP